MPKVGVARKAGDRRRVRAQRVVETPNNGHADRVRGMGGGRTAAFRTGLGISNKNGRA